MLLSRVRGRGARGGTSAALLLHLGVAQETIVVREQGGPFDIVDTSAAAPGTAVVVVWLLDRRLLGMAPSAISCCASVSFCLSCRICRWASRRSIRPLTPTFAWIT